VSVAESPGRARGSWQSLGLLTRAPPSASLSSVRLLLPPPSVNMRGLSAQCSRAFPAALLRPKSTHPLHTWFGATFRNLPPAVDNRLLGFTLEFCT
jgi:hypothetical protein